MPNHRNLNHVLGAIGWELEALGKKWGEEIPAINCIVVNKGNQTPGRGIQFHMSIADYKKLPKHIQKQELAKLHREIDVNAGENVTDALMGDPMRRALVQIQSIFAELDKNLLLAKLRKARERTRQSEGRCEGRKRFGTRPGELTGT